MTEVLDDRVYTEEHEWARLEGSRARVGITDHAQSELTDIVYVELPAVGREVKQGEEIGVVESVKAASEIYAPLSGRVVEANAALAEHPELVNQQPYGDGWMVVLELAKPDEAKALMDASAYRALVGA